MSDSINSLNFKNNDHIKNLIGVKGVNKVEIKKKKVFLHIPSRYFSYDVIKITANNVGGIKIKIGEGLNQIKTDPIDTIKEAVEKVKEIAKYINKGEKLFYDFKR